MIDLAEYEFSRAMRDSRNLIAIHRELNREPGLRVREMSLNRAVVVLTVAAWQAYVQDLVTEVLSAFEIPGGDNGRAMYLAIRAEVLSSADRFTTPNSENTRKLLLRLGFDPWPHWEWQAGPQYLSASRARERMDQWLKVRHAIAHGHDSLPDVDVLPQLPDGRCTLRRSEAEACMSFFTRIVSKTTAAAVAEFEEDEP
jgi:hypothetical protein